MTNRRSTPHRGFSLLEVAVVLLVIGIMAVAAAPSIGAARDVRTGGVVTAVERRLLDARSRAMASGRPHAVRIDAAAGLLETLWIPATGDAPIPPEAGPSTLRLADLGPAVSFVGIAAGDAAGSNVFWFGFDGRPESRDTLGQFLGPWVRDGEIRIGPSSVIAITRSGAVRR